MRSALVAFLAALVVGLVAVAIVWNDSRPEQSLGVSTVGAAATLVPRGPEICESPIGLGEPADAVQIAATATPSDTPAMEIVIRNAQTGAIVSGGHIRAGWDPYLAVVATLTPTVSTAHPVALCIRDIGSSNVQIIGVPGGVSCANSAACGAGHAISTSSLLTLTSDGRPTAGQFEAVFRTAPVSLGTLLANTFAHASLFRPGFVGRGFWWVLLALLVFGVPALLVWSMRALREHSVDGGSCE